MSLPEASYYFKITCNYMHIYAAAAAKSLQSCLTLCDPIDGSPPGSSVPGILQARTLEWVAISFSNTCMHATSLQSCLTLCNPMDSSPPGSSVQRILWQEPWNRLPFPSYIYIHAERPICKELYFILYCFNRPPTHTSETLMPI